MPCVFCYSIQNKARSPFHQTRQWCPQCWQTATLLVTISSRRGGGRFPFRSASCDQITGRNSSLNGHIHQPISSHHAKLWRVARRSRTSSTRTSRLRQRGHFMQSTPFLLWICTHYTACTPPLQSLFRHFVLRALNVSKSRPFHAIGMGRRLSSEKRIKYIRIRSWMYFFGGDTALLPVHCCAIFSGFSAESGTCGANSRSKSSSVGKISFTILTMFSQKSSR